MAWFNGNEYSPIQYNGRDFSKLLVFSMLIRVKSVFIYFILFFSYQYIDIIRKCFPFLRWIEENVLDPLVYLLHPIAQVLEQIELSFYMLQRLMRDYYSMLDSS